MLSFYTIWPRTPKSHPRHPPFLSPYKYPFYSTHLPHSNPNPSMQNTEELMASGCLDQHRFHPSHQIYLSNKKSLRDIDIPPRKLLSRRSSSATSPESLIESMYHQQQNDQSHSPRVLPEETLFKKFLPYNDSDEDSDPYSADHFRIYEFKVRKCTRSRSHDWTDCPFAHPGEKARRRCPRRYNYLGTVCADFRRGSCSRGDLCEFAHGVFECWLHPSRYRTEACKDGKNCQRKICFFAHTPRQLRVVPPETSVIQPKKHHTESCHCCAHCRCLSSVNHVNSPTSTLNNIDLESLSPPASPPFSPARSGYSPISRFADKLARAESLGLTQFGNSCLQNEALSELMRSMEAMSVEENNIVMNNSQQWVDECFNGGGSYDLCDSTPSSYSRSSSLSQQNVYNESPAVNGPDLGWVNDLLT